MAIGQLVKNNIHAIIAYCNNNPEEIERLCDNNYSKTTFGLSSCYSFFKKNSEINDSNKKSYYKTKYTVNGCQYRLCSQWYANQTYRFLGYLQNKGITANAAAAISTTSATTQSEDNIQSIKNSRWDRINFSDMQNYLIRIILSNLGKESFSENDWENASHAVFEGKCAYCGCNLTNDNKEKDHAVPINRNSLGEHKLGNLIPSCSDCNSKKRNKDYRDFLEEKYANDPETADRLIRKIEDFMLDHNYLPLTGNEQIKKILEMAYEDARKLAQRYINIINKTVNF